MPYLIVKTVKGRYRYFADFGVMAGLSVPIITWHGLLNNGQILVEKDVAEAYLNMATVELKSGDDSILEIVKI